MDEDEQQPQPTEAETLGQTPRPGTGKSPLIRNPQLGEYGEEGTREGNAELEEWDLMAEISREGNSETGDFENRKSLGENIENNNVQTRQFSKSEVEGENNLNEKVNEISSAEKESQKDGILEKQCERRDSLHEEERKNESLEEVENKKQDSDGEEEGEGKDFKSTKGENGKNPKKGGKGERLDSNDDESQQELNPGYSQLRGFRGTAPDGLSLLKPHQSDNLSAITEENSNLGEESTNKSFTEDEKDVEDHEGNNIEGKETQ